MKRKFVIYDIDQTVIDTDTMQQFILYKLKKNPIIGSFYLLKIGVLSIPYLLKIQGIEFIKSIIFKPWIKMNQNERKQFFDSFVMGNFRDFYKKQIKEYKKEGYFILFVTASPEVIMNYFKDVDFVDKLIGTKFSLIEGKKYKVVGKNCKYTNKPVLIKEFLDDNNLEIDFENSYSYSDSKTDIPMLKMVKNGFLVDKKTGEILFDNIDFRQD